MSFLDDWGSAIGRLVGGDPGNTAAQADANNPSNSLVAALMKQYGIDPASVATDKMATGSGTGTQVATDAVMGNPMNAGIYGASGLQGQMENEAGQLAKSGYSLQPEDYDAMGQASDNIARQSGSTENSIGAALAARGLSAGPSGAAGVAYSGATGNKLEALAANQQQIAQNRMQINQQRLQSVRSQLMQLNQQGNANIASQYQRQLQGAENNYNTAAGAAGLSMQDQNLQQNINNSNFSQIQATKKGSIVDDTLDQEAKNPSIASSNFASSLGKMGGGMLGGA